MKNLKLLALFSIAVFALLSFSHFTEVNQIKNGTYDADYSASRSRDGNRFFGNLEQSRKVTIKVENNIIIQLNQTKHNHPLLNQQLQIQKNGDATTEITDIYQPVGETEEPTMYINYKLKIRKEDLSKQQN